MAGLRLSRIRRHLCLAMLPAIWAVGATAQSTFFPVYSPLNAINSDVQYQARVSSLNANVVQEIDGSDLQTNRSESSVATTYRSSPTRTQQNLRNFVARTPDPAARTNLEQMIAAQPGIMDEISAGARSFGFDPHNVADAYAMWWMNAWLVANKRDEVPDNGTIAMVKSQVRNAFAATPDFAKTSDAERQEYAEALLLQATMLGSAFEQWKNDPKMLDQLADAARKGAEASGLDLSKMTLTPNGFVPRKGADASGAVGADAETIRNARADAPADEGEGSGLGLALAAGAGLGVTLLGGLALMRRG
jgi:hypothetical protein